jgi:hypothetical protein
MLKNNVINLKKIKLGCVESQMKTNTPGNQITTRMIDVKQMTTQMPNHIKSR